MTHKTDVPKTSDLAGFAAREAGHDPATRQFHELFDQAAREAGQGWDLEAVPIRLDKDGTWRHAETGKAVGPAAVEAEKGDWINRSELARDTWINRANHTRYSGTDWTWFDGEKDHRFKVVSVYGEGVPIPAQIHVDPEEEAARAARPRTTHEQIESTCNAIRDMLLAKNRKYGDSALDPVRIFSRASAVEQILVRLDDKLSRLRSAQADEDEDVVDDLIGYLVLLKIARLR